MPSTIRKAIQRVPVEIWPNIFTRLPGMSFGKLAATIGTSLPPADLINTNEVHGESITSFFVLKSWFWAFFGELIEKCSADTLSLLTNGYVGHEAVDDDVIEKKLQVRLLKEIRKILVLATGRGVYWRAVGKGLRNGCAMAGYWSGCGIGT
jgi:hypothetical protein